MPKIFMIKSTAGYQFFGKHISITEYRQYINHIKEYLENGSFYFVGSLKKQEGEIIMSNMLINIRFWYWHLQIACGCKKMRLSRNKNIASLKNRKKIQVFDFFNYHFYS